MVNCKSHFDYNMQYNTMTSASTLVTKRSLNEGHCSNIFGITLNLSQTLVSTFLSIRLGPSINSSLRPISNNLAPYPRYQSMHNLKKANKHTFGYIINQTEGGWKDVFLVNYLGNNNSQEEPKSFVVTASNL